MFPAKKGERECDFFTDGDRMFDAFIRYCKDECDCPMGCIRIKDKDSHMKCFAEWSLSKHRKIKKGESR